MLDLIDTTPLPIRVTIRLSNTRRAMALRADLVEHGFNVTAAGDSEADLPVLVTDDLAMLEPGQPAILVLTPASEQDGSRLTALAAGASLVTADTSPATLRAALAAVAAGLTVLPPARATELALQATQRRAREGAAAHAAHLTAREREVLELMAEGAANKAIARRLGITVHTVKFHVAAILDKLDATGRTDAVAQGARLGLVML